MEVATLARELALPKTALRLPMFELKQGGFAVRNEGIDGYTDVHGRMSWDRPAPALTTRCNSVSNGRFGHPCEDRAVSTREAAALQSFPDDFVFVGPMEAVAIQIGNAVPPLLARRLAEALLPAR